MDPIVLILTIIVLIVFSAYFSGSEAALFSLPATRIKMYRDDRDPNKRLISELLSHPHDLLVTIFMLNTLVNILLQNVSANLFGDFASWLLKVGVPLILTLIFGEIIPKYIGLQYHISVSYLVASSINFFQKILKPLRYLIVAVTTPLSRFLFFFLRKAENISPDELQHVLRTSEEKGILTKEERDLISGYLSLQDSNVKELMRPREDILFYNINEPLSKLIHLFVDQKCTRLPVCDPDLDHILGILTLKNFFLHREAVREPKDVIPLLQKAQFVPESTPAKTLLSRFQNIQQFLALVVDEYGTIAGLITREDILEVVVGDIVDKRDQVRLYTKSSQNEIIASGKLELDLFNDIFQTNLASQANMVTIGGWLTEQLGEIPKTGSKYEVDPFFFHILSASPSRINRLYIRKMSLPKQRQQ